MEVCLGHLSFDIFLKRSSFLVAIKIMELSINVYNNYTNSKNLDMKARCWGYIPGMLTFSQNSKQIRAEHTVRMDSEHLEFSKFPFPSSNTKYVTDW